MAKTPAPVTRIVWTDEEVLRLIKRKPILMDETVPIPKKADAIEAAQRQNVFPAARHRTRKLIMQSFHGEHLPKQIAHLARQLQAGAAADVPPVQDEEAAAAARAHRRGTGTFSIVRWSAEEWTRIAHDEEIKALLAHHPEEVEPRDALAILQRAQQRQLPADRHRPATILKSNYRRGNNSKPPILDSLREAIKRQPRQPIRSIHEPLPAAENASPSVVAEELAQEQLPEHPWFASQRAAQAAAAAPAEDPLGSLGSAVANLLNMTIGILHQRVAATIERELGSSLNQVVQRATAELRAANVDVISQLLGGSPPQPPAAAEPIQPGEPPKVRGLRVDIIGANGVQMEQVRKAAGPAYDLRFLTAQEVEHQPVTADHAIVLKKFVGHSAQERVRKSGAQLHYANGGIDSVLTSLRSLQQ